MKLLICLILVLNIQGCKSSQPPSEGSSLAQAAEEVNCQRDKRICQTKTESGGLIAVGRSPNDQCNFRACPEDLIIPAEEPENSEQGKGACPSGIHQCVDLSTNERRVFVRRDPANKCEFFQCSKSLLEKESPLEEESQ